MFRDFWAQLSYGGAPFMEDQAVHIVGQIGQGDLGLDAPDADGSDLKSPSIKLSKGFWRRHRNRIAQARSF